MRFESWEEKAYNELLEKYNDFFEELRKKSIECFKIDAHEIFKCSNELTAEQEKIIKDFWKKYIDDYEINYIKYYVDRTGFFDKRFIPDDVFVGYIDPYLNNRQIEPGVADKNYFDLYLKGFKMPKTYIHYINGIYEDENYNIITKEEAINILCSHERITVKPSMASYGGKNVSFFTNPSKEEITKYLNNNNIDNLIFQETILQSQMTAKLHPQSLNTIRIMTLIIDNKVVILPQAFRMGIGDSKVDNASFGGIYCKINEDGTLSNYAYDAIGNKFTTHPDGGDFSQVKFDFMDDVKNLVKEAAQRFPHFRLIGWDIAINENNEPIIIEANLTMSGLDVIETICGPVFGEYTEKVLNEVFINPNKKDMLMDISQYV